MRQARDERQQRIAQAIANGEEAKHRDIRPHRRTLAHRSRKKGPLGLTITDQRLFQVDHEGETLELPTSYPQPPRQPFFSDGLLTDANCRRGWLGALAYLPSSAADFRWRPEPTGISPPLPHGGRNIGHRHLNRLVVAYHRSSSEQYWVPEAPDSGRCPAAVQKPGGGRQSEPFFGTGINGRSSPQVRDQTKQDEGGPVHIDPSPSGRNSVGRLPANLVTLAPNGFENGPNLGHVSLLMALILSTATPSLQRLS